MQHIPIIDLASITSKNRKCSLEEEMEIASQIEKALNEIGFMYLINHGVPPEIVKNGFEESKRFFACPMETKLKYQKTPKNPHGFVVPGQELLHPNSVFELRECFDVSGNDRFYPTELATYQGVMETFETTCNVLLKTLLRLLAISLKLEDLDYFINCSTHLNDREVANNCDLRAIHYPAIPDDMQIPPQTVRCAEHTDYEIFTLLFQDEIGGLEVKSTNGDWLPATPIPGSILVNTGDLLEYWTCGYFPATFHRVVIPEEEVKRRIPRYSFAYFYAPDDSTVISPLKSDVISKSAKYSQEAKIITAGEHITERMRIAYQY